MNLPSPASGRFRFKAVSFAVEKYVRLDRLVVRFTELTRAAVGGFLAGTLTADEAMRLTISLYENRPVTDPSKGLFDWEREWYDRVLPPAPARILVAAAGSGREALVLARAGHRVDAFEPNARAAARCRAVLPAASLVATGSYSDFSAAVLDSRENPLSPLRGNVYDAVILGWGSLTHVLRPEDRRRCLTACHRTCPSGPILVSYWRSVPPASRAFRLARDLARRARRGRPSDLPERIQFLPHAGFGVAIDSSELESIASALARRFEPGSGSWYAHGTLLVTTPAVPPPLA